MGLKTLIQNATKKDALKATVGGEEFQFRKVRIAALIAARPVLHSVALAVSSFMDPSSQAYQKQRVTRGPEGEMVEHDAIDPKTAEGRQARQDAAAKRAVEALFEEKNIDAVLGLVIDSIREPEMKPSDLRGVMEIDDLVEMVKHTLTANASVFGPFAARVTKAAAEIVPPKPDTAA